MQYNITYRKKDKGIQFIVSYKDKNGKWKQKSKQGFKKKSDAKKAADKLLDELKEMFKNNIDPSSENITFGEFSDKYIEHLKLYRSINTILAFNTVLNHFKHLDDTDISKITTLDIQLVIDNLTKEGLNPNTIHDYVRKLNTIFKAARDEYNLIYNLPTKNIKINANKKPTNKKALNNHDENKLLGDFQNSKYYLIILLALKCGLRLGEILGLKWEDIDEVNNTITINKQWKQIDAGRSIYGYGRVKGKNSNRTIPISQLTLNELKKYKNIVNINNRIFSFKNTDSVSICLNALLKKEGYDITIHELRHTYATKLISHGLDFKTVARLLGHTVEQTMRTYSHVNDDMMNKANDLIQKIF
ncbi:MULTISPECIES: tyrosine-type recombinase/integrase [Clostridium]|uniref:tyrosine-type recombinase/integrase n=1 Tax=Clostridium sporogenes TaxID=1509 RepID=UPI0001794D2B|nr:MULTISPECIES: site-specific integrase [Clostridium]EDU35703.1 site-specific recombinase, phage integrase family [Clostridium sporogenes ATCC 15579]MBO0558875.1 site-specific integrase [Clostridium botulinum]NFE66662.1 site-specific integrase [Clostridium sporogenes]